MNYLYITSRILQTSLQILILYLTVCSVLSVPGYYRCEQQEEELVLRDAKVAQLRDQISRSDELLAEKEQVIASQREELAAVMKSQSPGDRVSNKLCNSRRRKSQK